jgi:hypothetical protein
MLIVNLRLWFLAFFALRLYADEAIRASSSSNIIEIYLSTRDRPISGLISSISLAPTSLVNILVPFKYFTA